MTDPLTTSVVAVGAQYGMDATTTLAYMILGDRRHPDAPPGECGAVDPRRETRWCHRPPGRCKETHCCACSRVYGCLPECRPGTTGEETTDG